MLIFAAQRRTFDSNAESDYDFAKNNSFVVLVRLAAASVHKGRLEIQYNDTWGTVCSDSFDDTDAKVFCYHLGFGYASGSFSSSFSPKLSKLIHI